MATGRALALAAALCAGAGGCAARGTPGARAVAGSEGAPAPAGADGATSVRLDATFARLALEELRTGDPGTLAALSASPAAAHLLAHARAFDNDDVPHGSGEALVSALLRPAPGRDAAAATCAASLSTFAALDADRGWIDDVTRYLPEGRPLRATLFLTFGYDIGVSLGDTASLNCGHPRFAGRPRELVFYAIHELHHAGFMAYQPAVPFARVHTCAELAEVVRRHTQMEGMAVWAAYPRRRAEGMLAADPDYVALGDEAEMRREEARWLELYRGLLARGAAPADDGAWAVVAAMSGERLWYRVGALQAQRIERAQGHRALAALVAAGPEEFLAAARAAAPPP